MGNRSYYVYILTNRAKTVLYTGVTNDLERRLEEHRSGQGSRFTARYHVHFLVFYDIFDDIDEAISCEKLIKAGSRANKIALIHGMNPGWRDLSESFFA